MAKAGWQLVGQIISSNTNKHTSTKLEKNKKYNATTKPASNSAQRRGREIAWGHVGFAICCPCWSLPGILILSLFKSSWLSKWSHVSLFGNRNLQVAAAHIVRDFHPSEFLGMLGLCGAIITFVQVRLSLSLFIQVRYQNSLFIHLKTSPFAFHHLCFFFGKYGKLIPKM